MNDLFSSSFSRDHTVDMEMGQVSDHQVRLDKFFEDVERIKHDLDEIEELHKRLKVAHEDTKNTHSAGVVKELRSRMHQDVTQTLKKAKLIKDDLEALKQSNEESLRMPECGSGSATERTRTSVVVGLGVKLKDKMDEFQRLRDKINEEYKETVQRRFYTVTGENPDENTVDLLISTGQSETFLHKAIQLQGRGQVLDTIAEIQERHDAVKDIERKLEELHQVFLDMGSLVQHQGEHLNNIQDYVQRAKSQVRDGTRQLVQARKHQNNTRKWTCFAIILLLIIVLAIVLGLHPWSKN